MIDLKNIITNSKKYHYITFRNNKIIKYISDMKKQDISIKPNDKLLFIKLKTLNKEYYKKEQLSPFKTTGGPLYVEIFEYTIVDGKVTKNQKLKNKIYFPKKYIQSKIKKHKTFKWMMRDIIKSAKLYHADKLKQQLMAINNINNI